jgi:hypothetical protein
LVPLLKRIKGAWICKIFHKFNEDKDFLFPKYLLRLSLS